MNRAAAIRGQRDDGRLILYGYDFMPFSRSLIGNADAA